MTVRPETWYWVRWTATFRAATRGGPPFVEVMPALPYFDENGAIGWWDSYHGEHLPSEVEVLSEIMRPV